MARPPNKRHELYRNWEMLKKFMKPVNRANQLRVKGRVNPSMENDPVFPALSLSVGTQNLVSKSDILLPAIISALSLIPLRENKCRF
jgi:hypothetical protein